MKTSYSPLIILLIAALLTCPAATAQESTFGEILERIVKGDPTHRAEAYRAASEVESLRAENMVSDPEVEFEHLWNPKDGPNRWSIGISQEFDMPTVYHRRGKLINAQRKAGALEMEADHLNHLLQAEQALIELVASQKQIAVLEEIKNSMSDMQNYFQKAWDGGQCSILDLNKIKIEAMRASAKVDEAQRNRQQLWAELRAMASDSIWSKDVAALTDFPLGNLLPYSDYETALANNPKMELARQSGEVSRLEASLVNAQKFPSLSIGYNHAYEDGTHFNGFSIGLTLPVISRKHARRAAKYGEIASVFEGIAAQNELTARLKADYRNAEALRKLMNQYGPLVEGVNNLQLLQKAFYGGQINLLEYLQEVNYFLDARLDYLEISKEYAITLASLNNLLPNDHIHHHIFDID